MRQGLSLAATVMLASTLAAAGTFEDTCQDPAYNGCDLASDQLVFAKGDPDREFVTQITECYLCFDHQPDGSFTIDAIADVEFGPYDPELCDPQDGTWFMVLSAEELIEVDDGSPGTEVYVPDDPSREFVPQPQLPLLKPSCVRRDDLDYEIRDVFLTGADGARTGDPNLGEQAATLTLPAPVRVQFAFGLFDAWAVSKIPIRQDLTFSTTRAPLTGMEFWPEGFPFRLKPSDLVYSNDRVDLIFGGNPYRWAPPADDGIGSGSEFDCEPTPFGDCTAVHNAGYFSHDDWTPTFARFHSGGMDAQLQLPSGTPVIYESVFPRGVVMKLEGDAEVTIADSALAEGRFQTGEVWLKGRIDPCNLPSEPFGGSHLHELTTDTIEIRSDGSVMAAITDLNFNEFNDTVVPVEWAVTDGTTTNSAVGLGCGTLYVPTPHSAVSPEFDWYESAVPTVLDRGIYPGLNYNRSQVCRDGSGQTVGTLCTSDADCASGETCEDGGFAPFCPALTGSEAPKWNTPLEGNGLSFDIHADEPLHSGREMAFFIRQSGVTGVFDGGDDPFSIMTAAGFDVDFETYGLAFERSESERGDTIARGGISFGWPADTDVPFDEMSICNCGRMDQARAPDQLVERELAYWDQTFYPYGLSFTDDSLDDCVLEASTCQSGQTFSAKACVQARTPMHRFTPDPDSVFGLVPIGGGAAQPDRLTPYSHARLDFDEDRDANTGAGQQPGWTYHPESFAFSDWQFAGSPGPGQGFGYVDATGDVSLPFFGLTPAGVRVGIDETLGYATADTHVECDEVAAPGCADDPDTSYFPASRKMANDSVTSGFRADYLRPEATSDPSDGEDEPGRGRGTIFASADCNDFDQDDCGVDLGSTTVGAGMILRPNEIVGGQGDLGAGAALRLYTSASDKSALNSILSPTRRQGGIYSAALGKLGIDANGGPNLPPTGEALHELLHATGAIHDLNAHPDSMATFNVDASSSEPTPPMNGSKVTGFLQFDSAAGSSLDAYLVSSNVDTGGDFFAMEASLLTVDRHTHEGEEPIQEFSKQNRDGASNNMDMPSDQSVPFPDQGGGSRAEVGVENDFMSWIFDFDMPSFQFNSLTGSIDLTKAGLAAVGIDKMGMTMKFYADGDWYFSAGFDGNFDGYRVRGDTLFGATKDMTPLRDIDAEVAAFLEDLDRFDGGFVTVGVGASIINYGCLLRLNGGIKVGGWYVSGFVGGRINAQAYGTAICLIDIKASLTLMGMTDFDSYKIGGNFWLGGGIGACEPDEWETPEDVMDDDWCAACVGYVGMTGESPPEDIEFQVDGPDFECKFFF